jgi:phage tail-like protein
MADRVDLDPLVECFFDLEISYNGGELAQAYFHRLSGGEMSIALIEHNVVYQSGNSTTLFIPGPTSFEPITLGQGVTSDTKFWKWWADVTKGKKARRDATIRAFGNYRSDNKEDLVIAEWSLENVWPLSISGFSFDLDSDQAFIAQITLVAESIERKS